MTPTATKPSPTQRSSTTGSRELLDTTSFDFESIEAVLKDSSLTAISDLGHFERAFKLAAGMRQLRQMITPEMMTSMIMPLMNTRLGFKTDQDPSRPRYDGKPVNPYPVDVVKECLIEALLRGANPVGNEFNIIAGGTYMTKEYFERIVGRLPGVTDLEVSPGLPQMGEGSGMIRVGVSWKLNGTDDCLKDETGQKGRKFMVKINKSMGPDAVVGKATRKALAAAFRQITGSTLEIPEGDVNETDAKPVDSTVINSKPVQTGDPVSELDAHDWPSGNTASGSTANAQAASTSTDPTGSRQDDRQDTSAKEDPKLAWEAFVTERVDQGVQKGLVEKQVRDGITRVVLALKLKGKEHQMTPEYRQRIYEEIEAGTGYFMKV